jgi:hypothetical protein
MTHQLATLLLLVAVLQFTCAQVDDGDIDVDIDTDTGGVITSEFAVHLTPESNPILVASDLGLEYLIKEVVTLPFDHYYIY